HRFRQLAVVLNLGGQVRDDRLRRAGHFLVEPAQAAIGDHRHAAPGIAAHARPAVVVIRPCVARAPAADALALLFDVRDRRRFVRLVGAAAAPLPVLVARFGRIIPGALAISRAGRAAAVALAGGALGRGFLALAAG